MAAVAEEQGHEVSIIDAEAEGLSQEKLVDRALKLKPDLIGLTTFSPFFHVNRNLAQALKERNPDRPIAIGSPHITIMKDEAFLPVFDYAFMGEGESSFPQFLKQLESGGDISQVKGVIFRKDGGIVNTGDPDPISMEPPAAGIEGKATRGRGYPLDQFPLPARHLLPMKKYRLGSLHGRMNFTTIQSMRGCPWKCIFCASDLLNTTRVIIMRGHYLLEAISLSNAPSGAQSLLRFLVPLSRGAPQTDMAIDRHIARTIVSRTTSNRESDATTPIGKFSVI